MLPQAVATVAFYAIVGIAPSIIFPVTAGFSAANMLYTVLAEMLPHARSDLTDETCALITVTAALLFESCRLFFDWTIANPELSSQMLGALGWSLIAGLSTGLGGVLVIVFVQSTRQRMNALLLGVAAGVMITLSLLDLILPHVESQGLPSAAAAILLGAITIVILDMLLGQYDFAESFAHNHSGSTLSSSTAMSFVAAA
eukprot:m.445871 g.445871  ORF g.445871 m.445871 type:complete len:200 (+) comp56860_c0_seq1:766-1365(+)